LGPGEGQSIQPIPDVRNYPPADPNGASGSAKKEANEKSSGPIPLTDPQLPLTPVPDLDAASGRKQVPAAPSLFDPRDRTASLGVRRALAVSPIVWPDGAKFVQARTVTAEISVESEEPAIPFESDGWRSVRP
jgi:hypothetical protein